MSTSVNEELMLFNNNGRPDNRNNGRVDLTRIERKPRCLIRMTSIFVREIVRLEYCFIHMFSKDIKISLKQIVLFYWHPIVGTRMTEKYITSQKSHFGGDQKFQFETDIRIIVRHWVVNKSTLIHVRSRILLHNWFLYRPRIV